jgi:O-succinylbenzoate synthase
MQVQTRQLGHAGTAAMAISAVDVAMWDLKAKLLGVCLADALPRFYDSVAIYGSGGFCNLSPDELREQVQGWVDRGFHSVKIKVGRDALADPRRVELVRSVAGDDVEIMVDANAAYTIDDADHLVELDEFHLIMLEQPLGADALLQLAELQRRMTTPLCLDESIIDLQRARDMIALDAGRIINIKPGRVGGFTVSKAIHDVCRAANIPVWCGGMLESGVGRAYNVALASLPNFTLPGDLSPSARYWARDIVTPEWTMDTDGLVRVPRETAGLGIEVDVDRIEGLTVRSEILNAAPAAVAVA